HCVDSPEHRTVEIAAQEAGGDALANEVCQWAVVTARAAEIETGRKFLANTMADNDRLPRKYLFTSKNEAKGFEFSDYRFAWLAALATFEQVGPAWVKTAKFKSVPELDLIRKYLEERLSVGTLQGREITLHRNIKRG